MDAIPHITLDCQSRNNAEVSLAERRSSFMNESSSSNSSIINIQDLNPSQDWQLPKILPSNVYKLKWWQYSSATQIKVSSIDVSFADSEEPVHINLIAKEQIDWAIKEGFKYAHLGAIKLGLGPLVHPYLPISSLCVVVNTRHRNFADAIIG